MGKELINGFIKMFCINGVEMSTTYELDSNPSKCGYGKITLSLKLLVDSGKKTKCCT